MKAFACAIAFSFVSLFCIPSDILASPPADSVEHRDSSLKSRDAAISAGVGFFSGFGLFGHYQIGTSFFAEAGFSTVLPLANVEELHLGINLHTADESNFIIGIQYTLLIGHQNKFQDGLFAHFPSFYIGSLGIRNIDSRLVWKAGLYINPYGHPGDFDLPFYPFLEFGLRLFSF